MARAPARFDRAHRDPTTCRVDGGALVADGNATSREALATALRAAGYRVTELAWRSDLLDYLGEPLCDCGAPALPSLIVAPWEMFCCLGGPEILSRVLSELEVPLILVASALTAVDRAWLHKLGVTAILDREGSLAQLCTSVVRVAPPRNYPGLLRGGGSPGERAEGSADRP